MPRARELALLPRREGSRSSFSWTLGSPLGPTTMCIRARRAVPFSAFFRPLVLPSFLPFHATISSTLWAIGMHVRGIYIETCTRWIRNDARFREPNWKGRELYPVDICAYYKRILLISTRDVNRAGYDIFSEKEDNYARLSENAGAIIDKVNWNPIALYSGLGEVGFVCRGIVDRVSYVCMDNCARAMCIIATVLWKYAR